MAAYSSKESGGGDKDEPVLVVSKFGKGKCVNFMLGHDAKTMSNPGFEIVLIRSVLWSGGVNLKKLKLQIKKELVAPKQPTRKDI